MKTIIQSEKVSVYQIKENHAAVVNSLGILVAIINRSNKEIIWQHGIQNKAQALFIGFLLLILIGTEWEMNLEEWNYKYADIEVNPLIRNYSTENQKNSNTNP